MVVQQPMSKAAAAAPDRVLPNIERVLDWRAWQNGLDEARLRRAPILALLAETWASSNQELSSALERDEEVRTLIADRFVPILVDPFQRPDLAARWRWASVALTGTGGPPLLILLSHEGLPFLSYPSFDLAAREPYPSLASLLAATSDAYTRDPDEFVREARDLVDVRSPGDSGGGRAPTLRWQEISGETDDANGGIRERPKHPHPQFLRALLEARSGETPGQEFARKTLYKLARGGVYDQLGSGFHRCTRDERWLIPHFEKPVPLSAQMAAVYARAANRFDRDDFRAISDALGAFCLTRLEEGVDLIGADSHYYTWLPKEVSKQIAPRYVQAVGFHFGLTSHASRHVLYRALEPESMGRFSHEAPEVLRTRVEEGRRQLLEARNRRPSPRAVVSATLSWPAEAIRWLLIAGQERANIDVPRVEASLERLLAEHTPAERGYPRVSGTQTSGAFWLEDQASLLAALVAAHRITGAEKWRSAAISIAQTLLSQYRREDGGWLDTPDAQDAQLSLSVTDDILPATLATLIESLDEVAKLTNESRYIDAARQALAIYRPAVDRCPPWWTASMRSCANRLG